MSFHFYLYRGPEALPPITEWNGNMAEPIGTAAEVQTALIQLLPAVEWGTRKDGFTFGNALDARYNVGHSLSTYEIDGVVDIISTCNHASPFTLAKIMDFFRLNYCCTSFGDFRQPHQSDDDWKLKEPI